MDRIMQMKQNPMCARLVFKEIGRVRWTQFDAFAVKTKLGATFLLSPNRDEGVPTRVHIDEILVPRSLQRRGVGTQAMAALCRLADKYHFRLEGGPIGWGGSPWRDEFVVWVLSFGFKPDSSPFLAQVDDPKAFYVWRLPRR
jgi:GNAT superfamily N-acetyltransferase